ncbi:MAG TPA: histidine kinase N-terminal 7TM domain-containing protein, partial [Thermoanaerobaculia bacterium]
MLATATLFTAAAILVLGVIVLARARATLVTYLFFAITVGASGWLGFFALMYGAASAAHAAVFARVASAFASILPAATFHFAAAYVSRRRALRNVILFCWVFCGAIAFLELATPYIVIGVRQFSFGYYPIGSRYNFTWALIFVGMFAAAVRLLWRAAMTSEGVERKRARALVVSFAVALLAAVEFLPSLGIDVMPLGFIAILAFIAIAAHAIWRYRLVELTPEYAAGQILATMKGAVIVVDL